MDTIAGGQTRQWSLNWNLLTIIIGITLALEIMVVLASFYIPRKGYTIAGLSVGVVVLGFLAYRSHQAQRARLLEMQGIKPQVFGHAGSRLNLILTVLISGTIFSLVSYVISSYTGVPLYFSIPETAFGVMLTVTKNLTAHEVLGKTLLIRVSFIELYVPIENIESVKADTDRLPDIPKSLKVPRRYRAVSAYFGYRVFVTLKKPQKAFVFGFPPH